MNRLNKALKLNLKKIACYPAPVRLVIFILALLVLWLPWAGLISILIKDDPNLVTILAMGLLFILFLVLLRYWGIVVHGQRHLLRRYGLYLSSQNNRNFVQGLLLGYGMCLGLFSLQGLLGWLTWESSGGKTTIVLEGLLSAVGIALAEETVFRGWLVDELDRDYSPKTTNFSTAIIFGLLHFLKPLAEVIRTLPQLPALIGLGLVLVWGKRSRGNRLGICIGLHAGLVWGYYILNVGKLFTYTNQVPSWITGIDGNPLAGLMGWLGLGLLGLYLFPRSRETTDNH